MGLDPTSGPPFAIIVLPGHPTTVVVKGELDLATAPELAQRLEELAATGQREVTVDLSGLEFLDSQGIHVLLVCPGRIQTNFQKNLIEDKIRFGWQNHRQMTAERCAQLIVRAMRRRRNELITTAQGKMLVWLNRLSPRLLDSLLARFSK